MLQFQTLSGLMSDVQEAIDTAIADKGVAILPPQDITDSMQLISILNYHIDVTMLDPWYNKGVGGIRDDYLYFFLSIIEKAGMVSDHIYFWGFPEIVAPFVERIPSPLHLTSWLTWYYKNNPSVIRGWRSSQNACLHISRPEARLYPERFLNDKQRNLAQQGKLRYMPGPTSVIEATPTDVIEQSLLVGFVGKKEQTGHPAQKPLKVYEQLLQMAVGDGGIVFDPMCGSGTTGAVTELHGFRAILCDGSDEYTSIVEKRLGVRRLDIQPQIEELLKKVKYDTSNPFA